MTENRNSKSHAADACPGTRSGFSSSHATRPAERWALCQLFSCRSAPNDVVDVSSNSPASLNSAYLSRRYVPSSPLSLETAKSSDFLNVSLAQVTSQSRFEAHALRSQNLEAPTPRKDQCGTLLPSLVPGRLALVARRFAHCLLR